MVQFFLNSLHDIVPRAERAEELESRARIVSRYERRSGAVHPVQKYAIFISAHAPAFVCPAVRAHMPAKRENRNKDSDDTREPG